MAEGRKTAVEIRNCRRLLGYAGGEAVEFDLPEFRAAEQEQVALTGPSGCGKSTFLNVVSGLIRPDEGQVVVQGASLGELSPWQRDTFRGRAIGFVYQSFNLLEPFSALENVLIGMRFGRANEEGGFRRRAVELLKRVGLQRRAGERTSRLSAGERQRVAIARALSNRPSILLADEPTGSLDPPTGAGVLDLILEVCAEERCTLLLVTHDSELASRLPRQFDCRGLIVHRGAARPEAGP